MGIKLFASDIDGTLLNNKRQISEGNKAKIRQAVKDGMVFTIATGRMFCSALALAKEVGIGDFPLIAYNGAMIRMTDGRPIYDEYMPEPIIKEVLDFAQEQKVYVQLYSDDQLYYREECDKSMRYKQAARCTGTPVGDEIRNITSKVSKMLVFVEPGEMQETLKAWQEKFMATGKLNVMQSSPEYIELINPTVSKANAIFKLAEIMGIDEKQILAIGDSGNDIPMLTECEYGVAMGNATPEAAAAANYHVADNEHDGLAEAIDRFFYDKKM